jgi:predicted peptidase
VRKLTLYFAVSLAFAIAATSSAFAQSANNSASPEPSAANPHIKNATAIGEVFAEGEKITTAILEYDQEIDNAKLTSSAFSVKDRKITKIYANTLADKAAKGVNGRFVVLELDPLDAAAAVLTGQGDRPSGQSGQSGPGGPSGQSGQSKGGPGGQAGPGGANNSPGATNRPSDLGVGPMIGGGGGVRKPVKVTVTQVAEIATVRNGKIPGNPAPFETNKARNLIVDDFQQLDWKDPVTGTNVMYNLYVPKNYDKNKSYPMVLFMHDASVGSSDHDRTLIQGLGAIVWATPEDQAKHPSFVLATQFGGGRGPGGPGGPGGQGGQRGPGGPGAAGGGAPGGPGGAGQGAPSGMQGFSDNVDLVYRLVNYLTSQYNIDKNRLYSTGQSAGCTTTLDLLIKYPDLFAAALPVAGQEDALATSVLKDKKMWIVVSEGDFRAFPGMNASIEVWEKAGAKVVKGTWSAREPASVQVANAAKMAAEHNNIMYTTFIKGTTMPPGMENLGSSEHLTSMRFAYAIPVIRDWLFQQSKAPGK